MKQANQTKTRIQAAERLTEISAASSSPPQSAARLLCLSSTGMSPPRGSQSVRSGRNGRGAEQPEFTAAGRKRNGSFVAFDPAKQT
jgi:hypothetical protein